MTSLHARGGDFYDQEIFAFWDHHLERDATHVIDLACGNGALSFLSDKVLNNGQPRTRITGIDFANINPFKRLRKKKSDHKKIEFIANTAIEKLPFDNHSVDMAISQWGLEYSDIDKAIPELGRVLKSKAKIALICHHDDSDILKRCMFDLEGMKVILGNGSIFEYFLALDKLYNGKITFEEVKADPERESILSQLNQRLYEINCELKENPHVKGGDYLNQLSPLFSSSQKIRNPQRQLKINEVRSTLENGIARYDHLKEAALTKDRLAHLCGLLELQGFNVLENFKLRYSDLGEIGTAIVAVRS